jgi:Flp pilus assembly pilin Flp
MIFQSRSTRELTGNFWQDTRGVTAIEYGVIIAGLALAIAAALSTTGDDLDAAFERVSDELQ